RAADGGPHHLHHRAPAVDGSPLRHDRRAARRQDRRAGHVARAFAARRNLRRLLPHTVRDGARIGAEAIDPGVSRTGVANLQRTLLPKYRTAVSPYWNSPIGPRKCCITANIAFNIPQPNARTMPIAAVNAVIYVAWQDYR